MYCVGVAQCYVQYYINNAFSASQITDRLFVGDLASASNIEAMKEQGITHIVSVFNGMVEMFPSDFKYKPIHINDDPWIDIKKYFDESNTFIDDALSMQDTKVMIHCQRGVSRSVTLLMAYLLFKINQKNQIPKSEISHTITNLLSEIKSHRSIADPNPGFMDSLYKYICDINHYTEFDDLTLSSIITEKNSVEKIEKKKVKEIMESF
jgi:protein tyrosine phosphatase